MVKNKFIRELIRILFVLAIQMLTTFIISYKSDGDLNLIKFFSNKLFLIFWTSYIIVTIVILFITKLYKKSDLRLP
jgi:magnesium-transporting ATPase (P-type)